MPRIFIHVIKAALQQKCNQWAIGFGILTALGAPDVGFWLLSIVGICGLLWLLLRQEHTVVSASVVGFAWGVGYYMVLFRWFLSIHPMTWLEVPAVVSILIAIVGFALAVGSQAIIVALVTGLIAFFMRLTHSHWPLLGFPLAWTAGLVAMNTLPISLPLGFITYHGISSVLIKKAVYYGSFYQAERLLMGTLTALTLLIYSFFKRKKRYWLAFYGGVLAVIVFGWFHIGSLPELPSKIDTIAKMHPLIIQGNISLNQEYSHMLPWEYRVDQYLDMTHSALHQANATAKQHPWTIIWPEGIALIPVQTFLPSDFKSVYPSFITGGTLLTNTNDAYNSVFVYKAPYRQVYGIIKKRYLVAFGETIPFIPVDWVDQVSREFNMSYGKGFSAYTARQPLIRLNNGALMASFICFEALYSQLAQQFKKQGAEVVVTVANLGWFHGHASLEKQFLVANQFRAIEMASPVILAANTGISAIIDANGTILARTQSNQRSWLTLP